jgi:hypothetical protein
LAFAFILPATASRLAASDPVARAIWSSPLSTAVGIESSFVSVVSDADRIYVVVVPPDLSARVVALDRDGAELSSTTLVPAGGVGPDPHNCFSIGLDARGHLHVSGNMHNGFWNYWVSAAPRSAAAFIDHSSTSSAQNWGAAKIGGLFATYPNFFRDNFGRLWLTARIKARDDAAVSPAGSLRGLRGGLLSLYDVHHSRAWEPQGRRAPAPGNTWRLPVVAWDDTGRAESAANPDPWYQGFRLNLDFDSANTLHLAWAGWGSRDEGAPYASDLSSLNGAGATHLSYLRRDPATGAFLRASGAPAPIPATRLDASVLAVNPGTLHFGAFVAAEPDDQPVLSYWQAGAHYLLRREAGDWSAPLPIPALQPDPARQLLAAPDGRLLFFDGARLLLSSDRGDTWTAHTVPTLKQLDKARFRRTGQLLGVNATADTLSVVEIRLPAPGDDTPAPADDPDYSTPAGQPLALPAPGPLGNDFHPAFRPLAASLLTAPAHGTVNLSADGAFTYTPAAGHHGPDTFTYRATDPEGRSADATVTVNTVPGAAEATAYEGFDTLVGPLANLSGATSQGFAGPWQNDYLAPAPSPLRVDTASLNFNYNGVAGVNGNHLGTDANATTRTAHRALAPTARFSFDEDGAHYLSFIARVRATPSTGAELQAVYLADRFGDNLGGFLRFANNRVTGRLATTQVNSTDSGQSGQTFATLGSTPEERLVVLKFVTRATGNDQLFIKTYRATDPLTEPTLTGAGTGSAYWALAISAEVRGVASALRVQLRDAGLAFDEFRLGRSFAAVTQPAANPAVVAFASSGFVSEGGTLPFQISRGDASAAVTVRYQLAGSATAGADYATPSGQLAFPAGVSVLPLALFVSKDSIPEDDETVSLALLPDPAYAVASAEPVTVTIPFNDYLDLGDLAFRQPPGTRQTLRVRLTNPKPVALSFHLAAVLNQNLAYQAITSRDPGGPAPEWLDISATGTPLASLAATDNAVSEPIPLGFGFPLFGAVYDALRISPNGLLGTALRTDLGGLAYRTQQQLPNFNPGFPVLAPLWNDWQLDASSRVLTANPSAERFILTYENLRSTSHPADRVTFQVVLHDSGRIDFNYLSHTLAADRHFYGVGISSGAGANSIQTHYSFVTSSAFIAPALTVRYLPPAAWLVPETVNLTLAPGESREVDIRLDTHAFLSGHEQQGQLVVTLPEFAREERPALTATVGPLTGLDLWRWTHFATTFDRDESRLLADPFSTGAPNLLHYSLGRAPDDTRPPLALSPAEAPGTLALTFTRAADDLDYVIESSPSLAPDSWTPVLLNPGTVGETVTIELPATRPRVFYRLSIER